MASERARIAAARVAALAMMVAIVVLVTAKSPLIRWLAVAAMGLNLSIAAGTFVYLYRRRQRLANHA